MATSTLKLDGLLGMLTIRLTDGNYLKWRYQIESVLECHDLFGHFDGSSVAPPKYAILDEEGVTSVITAAYKEWLKVDKALLSLLIATLSDEAIEYVIGSKTASEAWMNLTDRYATVSRARVNLLKTELQTAQKGADSIEKFLLRLKHVRDQLAVAGISVSDDDLMLAVLNGLPSEYDMVKTVLLARDTSLSFKDFRNHLLAAEQAADSRVILPQSPMVGMFSNSSTSTGSTSSTPSPNLSGAGILPTPSVPSFSPTGYMSSHTHGRSSSSFGGRGRFSGSRPFGRGFPNKFQGPPKSGIVPECQICSKRGHTAANCFFRNSTSSQGSVIECQICGKKGHGALDCYHRSNYAYQGSPPPSSLTAMAAQASFSPDAVWIADSGASHHMVPHMTTMHTVKPCTSAENVVVGNGEGLHIAHIGKSHIPTASSILTLSKVLHVPQLTANLLSVYQLCHDNNCRMIFDTSGFLIQDKVTNKKLLQGKSEHGLYPIPTSLSSVGTGSCSSSIGASSQAARSQTSAFLGQKVRSSLWHSRLGHPTNEVVQLMLTAAQIPVVSDSISKLCSFCLDGKMHRLPVSSHHNKASSPFYRLHSDVWGPSPCKSVSGYRYVVSFIDEYTGFLWLYPLYAKSEVFTMFTRLVAFLTNHFNASIKFLQSDGGGEYMSSQFTEFLASLGIVHQVSCPYTPQQNGLAERKNRHLLDTSITLLQEASMPDQFWFHAMAHSAYLINRMPSKVLSDQSPYYRLLHRHPDISHLRVFGTAVYPCLRATNTTKLQPRTIMCVFMGYLLGYKGVLCYNCSTGKFLVSRHVIHDETIFPFKHRFSLPTSACSPSNVFSPIPVVLPTSTISPTPDLLAFPELSQPEPYTPVLSAQQDLLISPALSHPEPSTHVLSEQQLQVLLPSHDSIPSSSPASLQPSVPVESAPAGPSHSMLTRSKTGVVQKKDFSNYMCYTSIHDTTSLDEPSSYRVASFSADWTRAMVEEISALQMQGTWVLVPPPANTNIVGSKWIYKLKRHSDGSISRYKARLVAQGFSQEAGFDYEETFSPVVRHATVRIILSLAAYNHWSLRQLDVKNAFLHGELEEEVYMKQPQGFADPLHPDYVCKLRKSLYGLKQAPRAWNAKFTGFLPALGFKMSHNDPSLFVKYSDSAIVVLLLYVDDIILTGSNPQVIQEVITELGSVFELKDMGTLTYFLGLQISYKSNGDIFVSQQKYATDLLAKSGMSSCKPCPTPLKPHTQILLTDGVPLKDPKQYRSIVGALQYLTFTRPDIAHSVNTVCQFMNNPTEHHFFLVKRILRYLQGTLSHGFTYSASGPFLLSAYSDSDWAGDINTRRSTTGFVVYLGSNPVSWQSKKQGSVSRSSTEAEYKALANASADVVWIRQLLVDLHVYLSEPPILYCDNLSALALSSNPIYHSRIKHLDIDFHFIRERVQRRDFLVQYIPTDEQVADVLTKGLHGPVFSKHCTNLRLGPYSEIEGGCLDND
ncbi:unnamed protein product [Prunus brigantina]